jgi:hypothetical protein
LEEIGYQSPAPAQMTACGSMPATQPETLIDCRAEVLASKEAILAARDEIRAMLTSGLAQTPPKLDARDTDSRRWRK